MSVLSTGVSIAAPHPTENTEASASWMNTILKGDCVSALETLPSRSVDLVFADPPYNLQLGGDLHRPDQSKVDACDDHWDQFESFETYDAFTRAWLLAARRVMKPDGSLYVIGSYHNIFRVGAILQDLGFWIMNDIVWLKSNPMPNFRGKRFTNAHETMIWAVKSKDAKPTFNYDALKTFNDDLQMRSDLASAALHRLGTFERRKRPEGASDPEAGSAALPRAHGLVQTRRCRDGPVLRDGNDRSGGQETGPQLRRCEREQEYIDAATARIASIDTSDGEALEMQQGKRAQKRIPFGTLLENGLLSPGAELTCSKGKHIAIVRADGSLKSGDHTGSIHKVGALVQGQEACNGWTFWHTKDGGAKSPIDELRKEIRSRLQG